MSSNNFLFCSTLCLLSVFIVKLGDFTIRALGGVVSKAVQLFVIDVVILLVKV